jgi:hypothetical protein
MPSIAHVVYIRSLPLVVNQFPAYIPTVATMLAIGNKFASIQEAWKAINRSVINDGESCEVYKLDSKRHILKCKEEFCAFSTQAIFSKKNVHMPKL